MTIRIALGDDHLLFRQALRTALMAEPDLDIVGEGGHGEEILAMVASTAPDVLLLDIALPGVNGIELARKIHHRQPGVKILALTGFADHAFIEEMLKAGASGYVVKTADTEELLRGIRAVHGGRDFLSSEATEALMKRLHRDEATQPPLCHLSPREQQVLKLLAEGQRSSQIAEELGIAPGTAEVHRRHIKEKLRLHTTAELTHYAIREGLVTL